MKITERNSNESAKDYVVRQLIYNIVHLNLIPGQKLETPQLCELLHVSSTSIVNEIRELRSVLESELAIKACDILTKEQLDKLWENVAMWQMYIKRDDEEKIFSLDKEFHSMLYHFCNNEYWYKLVNNVSPLFDRTTILSFRCNEKNRILHDHEDLVKAIEQKNKKEAATISRLHMTRYTENIDMMKQSFSEYFK